LHNEWGLFNISVQGADSVPLPDWVDQCCQEKGGHCGRINLRLSFQVQYKVQQFTTAAKRKVGMALWQDQFASVLQVQQGSEFTTAAKRKVGIEQDQFAFVLSGTLQGPAVYHCCQEKGWHCGRIGSKVIYD
jgi:hypothetical protein